MNIYHYHHQTGEYRGTELAQESPLEPGVFLIPAHATNQAPPQAEPGKATIWKDGAWTLVTDNRNTEYWLPDGEKKTIETLDESIPKASSSTPPQAYEEWNAKKNAFVINLAQAKAGHLSMVNSLAERTRQEFLTHGTGQALTYIEKKSQAQAFKKASFPSNKEADYPLVAAEAEAMELTMQQASESIMKAAASWDSAAAKIEAIRRTAHKALKEAQTIAAVKQASATAEQEFTKLKID